MSFFSSLTPVTWIGVLDTIRPVKITLPEPWWVTRRCQPFALCQK